MTTRRSGTAALLLLTSVELLVFLEVSIVNVGLPALGAALRLDAVGLAWVVNGYQLSFGGLQLVAGRAVDVLGRRRIFLLGLVVFTGASLVAGLAWSAPVLVAARVLQGVGAALVVPAELALLAAIFTEPDRYRRAFATWSAMGAAGAASGVALGGVLVQLAGWPAIFLINLPIGLLALALAPRVLPPDPPARPGAARRVGLLGPLCGTGALCGAVFVATELAERGWTATVLLAGVSTVLLAVGFGLAERRSAAPMIPPGLRRLPAVGAGAIGNALVGAAHVPAFVLLSVYLQGPMGWSAIEAGFAVLPIALVNLACARSLLPWAMRRYDARTVLAAGMALLAAGLLGFAAALAPTAGPIAVLVPGVVFALGLPAVFAAATAPAVRSAPPELTGVVSGVVNTAQRIGAAFGVTGLLLVAQGYQLAHPDLVGAMSDGLRLGFLGAAAVAVIGMVAAVVLFPRERIG